MEEKEKVTVETISKEEIEKVINTITKAGEEVDMNNKELDLVKVKEVISNFEGCTPQTVVGALATALLLLPAGGIMAVIKMGKEALAAKAMSELMGMVDKEYNNCECEERIPEE